MNERIEQRIPVLVVGGSLVGLSMSVFLGRLGVPHTVIEVQNGVPFLARIWARRSHVVVLVHHVHREQWHVVLPAPLAGVGWWVESRLAPRVNRRTAYVAVSRSTF